MAEHRSFILRFIAEGVRDADQHPLPLILNERIVLEEARRRLIRVTLRMVHAAGPAGVPTPALRAAFEAMDVEVPLRDAIERVLVDHGLVKAVGDRLVICAKPEDWARLVRANPLSGGAAA
jgi:hypothetical protein